MIIELKGRKYRRSDAGTWVRIHPTRDEPESYATERERDLLEEIKRLRDIADAGEVTT